MRRAIVGALLAGSLAAAACSSGAAQRDEASGKSSASSYPSPSVTATPTVPTTAISGEPPGAEDIEGKLRWPFEAVPSPNGTLMLTHRIAIGCYYRLIRPDGSVIGWFGPAHVDCPRLTALANGFLGVADEIDDEPALPTVDLSTPPAQTPVRQVKTVRAPEPGDTYLRGYCAYRGCAYSPSTHAIYTVDAYGYLIDAAGRFWAEGKPAVPHTITVSTGGSRWTSPPFPSYPNELVATADGTGATYIKRHWHRLYVTNDYARTWARIPEPRRVQLGGLALLPDGRILLTPQYVKGSFIFWRGQDSTNRQLEAIDSGPITSILVAGDRLYGMATRDWIRARRGVVWMSEDSGDTWRQVLSVTGATPHTSPVPATDLPDPIVPPKS